jgi:5-methylcytosine-specific restriction protein A
LIRTQFPEAVRERASIGSQYKVEGSAGQGNWAEVPWLCVFDRDITESAQRGYYIVYLFNAQLKGVYLSLNQGWTQYEETYRPLNAARERISANAEKLQSLLSSRLGDFSTSPIVLDATNTLGRGYELGHVCGVYYPADRVPNDPELVDDLRNLMGVYREAKGLIGNNLIGIAQMPSPPLDEDVEDQTENNEAPPASLPSGPLPKPEKRSLRGRSYYPRNPRCARKALIIADYRCEMRPEHITFRLKTTGNPYMETHHLIPMKFQDDFGFNIDVPENIVSVCPNCHQLLHRASDRERKQYIETLHRARHERLLERGIAADLKRALTYYDIR